MVINHHTKIAVLLKHDSRALDAIISLNKKFEKLRNPILRKLMAGRTTILAAANMGGVTIENFFEKLQPLGFEIEREVKTTISQKATPVFMQNIQRGNLFELDVRPFLGSGKDPLSIIMEKIKALQPGQVIKIINSFEPTPLILLLEKKGFETCVNSINEHLVETYFHKIGVKQTDEPTILSPANDWDQVLKSFDENIQTIDVRQLEMPQPMFAILEALDQLPASKALLVHHKKVPVYLLPELAEKGFEYRINELAEGDVNLLIFKSHGLQ